MRLPRGYGQFCPVAKAAETLSERWTLLVVRELVTGSRRFSDLQRGIPLISPTMLSLRLRQLVDGGIAARLPVEGGRGNASWEYELTEMGRELGPLIHEMAVWGQRWALTELNREDLEPAYLMWACHKNMRPAALGEGRTLIQFEVTDGGSALRRWWILVDGDVELCLTHPGYAVDLTLWARCETLARICLGHVTPEAAVAAGAIRFEGSAELARSFPAWCPRSPIGDVPRPPGPAISLRPPGPPKRPARSSARRA